MTKVRLVLMGALLLSTTALTTRVEAQERMLSSCLTRTVNANFGGSSWMAQHVCAPNEVAVSGAGFCSQAGQMVGASTTNGKQDQDVWLWCTRPGPAVWYGTCCQQSAPVPAHRSLRNCLTRTVNAQFPGGAWAAQPVCAPNEVAVSGSGFCSQAGQMVGASTTMGRMDQRVWLQCTQPGPAVWYAMCCQQ